MTVTRRTTIKWAAAELDDAVRSLRTALRGNGPDAAKHVEQATAAVRAVARVLQATEEPLPGTEVETRRSTDWGGP